MPTVSMYPLMISLTAVPLSDQAQVSTMATVSMYPLMVSLIVPPSHYAGGFSEGAAVSISVTSGSMKGRIEGTLSSAVSTNGVSWLS